MINTPIFSSYIILHQIGLGGMATVYLAAHKTLGHQVAIKVLNKEFTFNQNIRSRFVEEAKKMVRMNHPNVVKVTDLIDEENIVAIVMEYVEGKTLGELSAEHKFSDEEIRHYLKQMLQALSYIHKQGLIHRDIKPSNFILGKDGHLKLTDFGISKSFLNKDEHTQTSTSMSLGTPMYMSPEQVRSTKDVTHLTDIYSLGVVLWQLVSGQKPYSSETTSAFDLQLKIVQDDLPFTHTHWDKIIQKATQKDETKRFQSAEELLSVLDNKEVVEDDFERTVVELSDEITLKKFKGSKKKIIFNQLNIKIKHYLSLVFIIILFLLTYRVFASRNNNSTKIKTQFEYYNLKGNVKFFKIINYSSKTYIDSTNDYNYQLKTDFVIDRIFTRSYDKLGNTTYFSIWENDKLKWFEIEKIKNYYYADKNLKKSFSVQFNNEQEHIFYFYKNGNLIKKTSKDYNNGNYMNTNYIKKYFYNKLGYLKSEFHYFPYNNGKAKIFYLYNNENKLLKESIYIDNKLDNQTEYFYRSNKIVKKVQSIGLKEIIEEYNSNGDIIHSSSSKPESRKSDYKHYNTFEYEYDHMGNWIIQTEYSNSYNHHRNYYAKEISKIVKREIIYY
jgi:serine/threonine protein kinase